MSLKDKYKDLVWPQVDKHFSDNTLMRHTIQTVGTVLMDLAIQTERIADALQKQDEPTLHKYTDHGIQNLPDKGTNKDAGYSWDTEMIDLKALWNMCGNRERFLDAIMHKLNALHSVFGTTTSLTEKVVEGESSLYNKPDTEHPDYKGNLG